jgi:hypothetical protein
MKPLATVVGPYDVVPVSGRYQTQAPPEVQNSQSVRAALRERFQNSPPKYNVGLGVQILQALPSEPVRMLSPSEMALSMMERADPEEIASGLRRSSKGRAVLGGARREAIVEERLKDQKRQIEALEMTARDLAERSSIPPPQMPEGIARADGRRRIQWLREQVARLMRQASEVRQQEARREAEAQQRKKNKDRTRPATRKRQADAAPGHELVLRKALELVQKSGTKHTRRSAALELAQDPEIGLGFESINKLINARYTVAAREASWHAARKRLRG